VSARGASRGGYRSGSDYGDSDGSEYDYGSLSDAQRADDELCGVVPGGVPRAPARPPHHVPPMRGNDVNQLSRGARRLRPSTSDYA